MKNKVNSSASFACEICNKKYSSKSSLCNHNKKFHNSDNVICQKTSKNCQKNVKNCQNMSNFMCNSCNKNFNSRQSLWYHQKKCMINKSLDLFDENEKLKKQLHDQQLFFQNQIDNLKKELLNKINKQCKIKPKTLNNINNQLNNCNITNNFINIIPLGNENLDEILSKKEKIKILSNRYSCLENIVKYVHFNDKYPQFRNILITNLQNTIAYKYNNDNKQFIAIDKNELLNNIINERINDISIFYDELENELDSTTKDIIQKFIEKIYNEDEIINKKKDKIKLIIYNNSNKITTNLQVII